MESNGLDLLPDLVALSETLGSLVKLSAIIKGRRRSIWTSENRPNFAGDLVLAHVSNHGAPVGTFLLKHCHLVIGFLIGNV